jgi:hypothetical protein
MRVLSDDEFTQTAPYVFSDPEINIYEYINKI